MVDIIRNAPDVPAPYQDLLTRISSRYVAGQAQAARSVNEEIVATNWRSGSILSSLSKRGNVTIQQVILAVRPDKKPGYNELNKKLPKN